MHTSLWANSSHLQTAHQLVRMCGAQETMMAAGYENDEYIGVKFRTIMLLEIS
jgi:hypothetical protein